MKLEFKGTVFHETSDGKRDGEGEGQRGETKDGADAEEDGEYMPALPVHCLLFILMKGKILGQHRCRDIPQPSWPEIRGLKPLPTEDVE